MVRIRYILESESRLVSKPITSAVGTFRTVIERAEDNEFEFTVQKLDSPEAWTVRSAGHSRNLTVAKNKAKALLKAEGVSFLDEVRRRKERTSSDG